MELKAEHVENIRSLAVCKEFLRQAVEQVDQRNEVIAKLNRQVDFLQTTHSSCNDCNKCADGMGRVFDEYLDDLKEVINSQERVIHRQKYKRCLAMAKLCRSEWAVAIFIPEKCLGDKHAKRYVRWENRWLNIAAQFKEAKE